MAMLFILRVFLSPVDCGIVNFTKLQKNAIEFYGWTQLCQRTTVPTRSSAIAEKQRVSCPHGGGLGPPAHPPPPFWLHLCVWSNPKPATNLRQACCPL